MAHLKTLKKFIVFSKIKFLFVSVLDLHFMKKDVKQSNFRNQATILLKKINL